MPTCVKGDLSIYQPSASKPWNALRVKHLYKRMGFGTNANVTKVVQTLTPSAIVDQILTEAMNAPLLEVPSWINLTEKDYESPEAIDINVRSMLRNWMKDILQQEVRGKFILFWHNHFVTRVESYYFPTYIYEYHKLLQTMSFGNFREFTYEMGKTPAMLFFLNGFQNTQFEPNENYARELFELFTLGQDNGYTQTDIVEASRALTGWNNMGDYGSPITFQEWGYDQGNKTIFGKTGSWDYDELHDILFEERREQIAQFICQKLYTHFVNPTPDKEIINGLAQTFLANNWELVPVYQQLFKSEHFFDEANINILVKSPYALYLNYLNDLDLSVTEKMEEGLMYFTGILGQELGTPIDVAGWQGNRAWIDTARITGRWRTLSWWSYDINNNSPEKLSQLVFQLTDNEFENDPALVVQKVIDHFIPRGIHTPEIYERALVIFKADVPQNYFDDGSWNISWDWVPWQMTLLLMYINRLPEYQLN